MIAIVQSAAASPVTSSVTSPISSSSILQSATSAMTDAQIKVAVIATLIVIVLLTVIGLPFYQRLVSWLGAAAGPGIATHNADDDSHPQLREAIQMLTLMQQDLQRQIKAEAIHRRDALKAIEKQLDLVIKMIEQIN